MARRQFEHKFRVRPEAPFVADSGPILMTRSGTGRSDVQACEGCQEIPRWSVGRLRTVAEELSHPAGTVEPPGGSSVLLPHQPIQRSEEHTSELQSLMRISYAVFCLKKTTCKDTYVLNT